MSDNNKINIEVSVSVKAPLAKVWQYWTEPEHIVHWNAASADWHTTKSANDLRIGGRLSSRMEAKDGSAGFDFWGVYLEIIPQKWLSIELGDGRKMSVSFSVKGGITEVVEVFEAETENSIEMQRNGWQSILDNFKLYVESKE